MQELWKMKLSNNTEVYAVARDEMEANDKVDDFIKDRFFAGNKPYIISGMLIAEDENRGSINVSKLVV